MTWPSFVTIDAPDTGSRNGDPAESRKLKAAVVESSLIIHNPPDIPLKAEILGVCVVSMENADQNKYGWIVADFLRWKTLFHQVGNKAAQTWLSSLDIAAFLEGVAGLDINNSDEVAQKILGGKNDHIVGLPTDAVDLKASVLKHIIDRARVAKENDTTLFIMVFAPVTPEQDICIDFENQDKIYLPADQIRQVIWEAVDHTDQPVILMTSSPFTGGWACSPSIMGTCTVSDRVLNIMSKSCGAAFANRFIDLCTTRRTPLLTDDQRIMVEYDDMMPLRPTDLQIELLHKFQRKIHEVLEQRLSGLAVHHALDFEESSDAWTTYAPRTGRPLAGFWAKRWDKPSVAVDQNIDRFEFFGEAFGGTRASQIFHLKYLATIELETCPGDWTRGVTGITHSLLSEFLATRFPEEAHVKRVFDSIEFRGSSMIVAQVVAKYLDLPEPDGVKCRYWSEKLLDRTLEHKFRVAFGDIHNLFDQVAVPPGEKRHEYKTVRFWRASRWLATAIAMRFADASDKEIQDFISNEVRSLFGKIFNTQLTLLLSDQSVTCLGNAWLAWLGLRPVEVIENPLSINAETPLEPVRPDSTSPADATDDTKPAVAEPTIRPVSSVKTENQETLKVPLSVKVKHVDSGHVPQVEFASLSPFLSGRVKRTTKATTVLSAINTDIAPQFHPPTATSAVAPEKEKHEAIQVKTEAVEVETEAVEVKADGPAPGPLMIPEPVFQPATSSPIKPVSTQGNTAFPGTMDMSQLVTAFTALNMDQRGIEQVFALFMQAFQNQRLANVPATLAQTANGASPEAKDAPTELGKNVDYDKSTVSTGVGTSLRETENEHLTCDLNEANNQPYNSLTPPRNPINNRPMENGHREEFAQEAEARAQASKATVESSGFSKPNKALATGDDFWAHVKW